MGRRRGQEKRRRLSGTVAQAFVQVFSSIGATVVFVLAFLLLALGAFNRTIVDVADWIFNRPEYEPQEIPERPRRQAPAPAARVETKTARGRSADIDIPVEDGPLVGKEPQPTPAPEKRKGSFFNRISRVPAPDQLLRGTADASPAQPRKLLRRNRSRSRQSRNLRPIPSLPLRLRPSSPTPSLPQRLRLQSL